MRGATRTRAALLVLGVGAGALASCTTLLGIDDSLPGPDDASASGDAVAPGTDGGVVGDATFPDDAPAGEDASTADVEVTRTIAFNGQTRAIAIPPLGALGSDPSFGQALALSPNGTVLAIGAPGAGRADSDAGLTGQVQLVTISLDTKDGSGTLSVTLLDPRQGVTAAPVAGGDFGRALAFSTDGRYLAVGAPAEPHTSVISGSVYLYQLGPGGWSYLSTFQPTNKSATSFGHTVAFSGSGLYIAATGDTTEGEAGTSTSMAAASVSSYLSADGGGYVLSPYATATSGQPHDGFGWSLAVSADNHLVAIGAPFAAVAGDTQDGVVYLTSLSEFPAFATSSHAGATANGGVGSSALFGYSLALANDKSQVYIGAPGASSVRIWDLDGGTDVFTTGPAYLADPSSPAGGSRFGASVVAQESTLVIGAPTVDGGTCWTLPLPGPGTSKLTELAADAELSLDAGPGYGTDLATNIIGTWVAVAAPGTSGAPGPVVYLTR